MNLQLDASAIAIDNGERCWTFAELQQEIRVLAAGLRSEGTHVLATLLDNSAAWVIADRAAEDAQVVHVPLPVFFTPEQIAHALTSAGVDTLLTAQPFAARWSHASSSNCMVAGQSLVLVRLTSPRTSMPVNTAKITFTSGTTGAPKGVCLDVQAMRAVADGLVDAMRPLDIRRHLCALPFAVLLENIAGVMAPLLRGATCVTLPLAQLGLSGSSSFDPLRFHASVVAQQPNSIILLPQMLRVWTGFLTQSGQRAPASLKLVAVGGASVGAQLLQAARAAGIPAYEGYGLSEGASVQTLNLPGADRLGSAGRTLSHSKLRVAVDGEIEVSGSLFLGYLGAADAVPAWFPTGDLGEIDADGFLHICGRKKNLLITAFGRNVSPEWVETGLRSENAIAHAVVFGDDEPALSAVLWPVWPDATDLALQRAVDSANASLPDYARVERWVRGKSEFSAMSGLATANGRPQRAVILQLHAAELGLKAHLSTTL
jgi:long-subunit acyl-CoA synthetase (AMP-forming)